MRKITLTHDERNDVIDILDSLFDAAAEGSMGAAYDMWIEDLPDLFGQFPAAVDVNHVFLYDEEVPDIWYELRDELIDYVDNLGVPDSGDDWSTSRKGGNNMNRMRRRYSYRMRKAGADDIRRFMQETRDIKMAVDDAIDDISVAFPSTGRDSRIKDIGAILVDVYDMLGRVDELWDDLSRDA